MSGCRRMSQDVAGCWMLEEEDSNAVISQRELCELRLLGEHQQEQAGCGRMLDVGGRGQR